MEKRIAVLIRDRHDEALRMALGLLMLDDIADIYLLDSELESTPKVQTQLKTAIEMEMNLFTNCANRKEFVLLSNEEIANRLPDYDAVLNY